MRKQNIVHKALVIVALVFSLSVSVATVSVVASSPAEATAGLGVCGSPCISPSKGVGAAFSGPVLTTILGWLADAQAHIIAFFDATFLWFVNIIELKVTNPHDGVIVHVWDAIGALWEKGILPPMLKMTAQLSTLNADQSRTISTFADAANLNRTMYNMLDQEIDSLQGQRTNNNICVAGTVTGGLTRIGVIRDAYNAQAPVPQAGRTANSTSTVAGTGGRAADTKRRFQRYVSRYCNKDDNNGAAGCTNSGTFAGQDIDVRGTIFSKDTINVTNADTKKTVDDLIETIAEPFVKEPVPPAAVNSAAGQQAILAGESYRAKRQVIYDSLYHVVSRRAPGSKMGSFVRPLRLAAGVDPSKISDNPSHNEVMQALTTERFSSGKYMTEQSADGHNQQREQLIQRSFQIMQISDQLDLLDRYSLVMAAQVGAEVRDAKRQGTSVQGAPIR